jgi:small subunit ribosomal protein S1
LALSHKHIEENPWDTFENIFEVGSVHDASIISKSDKAVVLELPYGIEGTSSLKGINKEEGSVAEVGDKLKFEVTEFNKDEKKIVLSHAKTWEAPSEEPAEKKKTAAPKADKVKLPETEKSTLGDISALAALKDQLVSEEAASKKKATKKKSDEE